ncbi:MAG: hypothetical protein VW455_00735 [Nitrospinota bacterium]
MSEKLLNLIEMIDVSEIGERNLSHCATNSSILVVKNFLSADYISKNLNEIKNNFLPENDCYKTGPLKVGMPNFQRFDMGNHPSKNPKCLRAFTLFTWAENSAFKDGVNKMMQFRDEHFSLPDYMKNNDDEFEFKDYPRIVQYPTGAGFLNEHIDEDKELYPAGTPNMLVCLTCREKPDRKGDFKRGGLYYIHNGEELDVEEFLDVGDLCIHNQKVMHGVKTVDSGEKPKLDNFSGRFMLLLSIYRFKKQE